MASASVPNSDFTNGQVADANQVDANFAALVTFLNNEVVHRDGSKAFTGLPDLPTDSPGTNSPVRNGALTTALAAKLGSPTSNLTLRYGSASTTLDGSGQATVTFTTFSSSIAAVFIQATNSTSTDLHVTSKTISSFIVNGSAGASVAFDWFAIGV